MTCKKIMMNAMGWWKRILEVGSKQTVKNKGSLAGSLR